VPQFSAATPFLSGVQLSYAAVFLYFGLFFQAGFLIKGQRDFAAQES
jgi:hypothetical protein